ncbi:MAG TPA: hypothetical protein PKW55_07280 [Spirochaetota bacterium]|nr:hypothetical protein [Spirochaetota bacterium]HOM38617.1 hypothetical protein [Spirochaetota bacterium]HPQ49754.1 hypothetical protein [Spirochaetota bacterium]
MKKIIYLGLSIVFILLTSCSKNLSMREASTKDVATNFLKDLSEGNIEKAKLYILSQLIENEDIKSFLSKKLESYEYIEEIEPLSATQQVKNIIEKDKNKIAEIKDKLESYQKGLSKVINEDMHIIKINENGEEKYYALFIFASQNLKSITSILDISGFVKSVGTENIKNKIESAVL